MISRELIILKILNHPSNKTCEMILRRMPTPTLRDRLSSLMKSCQTIYNGIHLTDNQKVVLDMVKSSEKIHGMVIAELIDYQAAGFSRRTFLKILSALEKKGLIKPWRYKYVRTIVLNT